MRQWLILFLIAAAVSLSGCFTSPTTPSTLGSGLSCLVTPTPTPGGYFFATPTPGGPIPTPGSGASTYSVTYEIISTNCSSVNATYLDSDTTSKSLAVPGGTWSQTVTISTKYEAQIVAAYGGVLSMSPTLTLNIRVNGTLVATQNLNGFGPAITCSYWLP